MDDDDEKGKEEVALSETTLTKKSAKQSNESEYGHLSDDELKEMLRLAIDDEAYEKAGKIRDEMNKRKKA
jgi:protein-arginine kinase activator protein McsA